MEKQEEEKKEIKTNNNETSVDREAALKLYEEIKKAKILGLI